MLTVLAFTAFAAPIEMPTQVPAAPSCRVDPDKKRVKRLRSLVLAETREAKSRAPIPANKYRRDIIDDYLVRGAICTPGEAVYAAHFLVRSVDRADHYAAWRLLAWAASEGHPDAGVLAAAAWKSATPKAYDAKTLYETPVLSGGRFNHDATRLLIGSNETGVFNVYAQPFEGGERVALTTSTGDARWPVSWFPSDDRVLFRSDIGGDEQHHLWVRELDGTEKDLTPGQGHRAEFLGFSTDGKALYFATNERDPKAMDVYRLATEGYERTLLFENTDQHGLGDLSSDGRWLVLDEVHSNVDNDLWLVDLTVADAEPVLLTTAEESGNYGALTFEPDSGAFWYRSDRGREFDAAVRVDLETMDQRTAIEADWDVWSVGFSEQGTYRVHSLNADAQDEVFLVDTRDGKPVEVPAGLPSGEISGFRISKDEKRVAMWVSTDTAPSSLYVAELGGPARLLAAPASDVDPADLVDGEVVRFPSFDGLQIPAILYVPHGASELTPAPAVVWVHGGPGGQSRRGYSARIQFLVNHGYAVLAINNRGSSGYGKTFNHADDRKHGDVDLKDCIAGRDFLAGMPEVDGERIGIMGGSYGGYMVLAALAFQPDAFEVGVDVFGVSNWIRTLESIPPWWESFRQYLYAELGDPVADRESLEARSPLLHADQITKPLLVVQGKNDPRVLEAESAEIVEAVRKNGVPVEYVLFEDEGHGFVKTSNQITAAETWLRFLDTHLAR